MEDLTFLTLDQAIAIREEYGSPIFVYDQATLQASADEVLAFPNAYGLTARYAMKALPAAAILQTLTARGLHIDASSGYEAQRALNAGIPADHIQITAQEIPDNLRDLVDQGVLYNACSVHQLESYGKLFTGTEISIRVNPGLGSGHNNRTNVGGPSSSFGIWHGHLDQVETVRAEFDLKITGMHTHVGSGGDPEVWKTCAKISLDIVAQLPDVTRISLGGGFKVARMPGEVPADLQAIGKVIVEDFKNFAEQHNRELQLELEPGTFLVANAGVLISTITDVVDTGDSGYNFLKIDSGMTEVLRPSHYGAQQPMTLIKPDGTFPEADTEYVVAGHCCESGDILTPAQGDPEGLEPRKFPKAEVGDLLVISGSGAYCSSMSSKNYNSFPEAAEVMIMSDGSTKLIRKRQDFDQITVNEIKL
ncbi:diaminopimelate decarboxylase [bacterium AH-315-P07]|nr:diaminopimelate decarboxylase [bacterium AH-315-P07]